MYGLASLSDKRKHFHIYKITNILTDKNYIGSTVDVTARWRHHRKCLEEGTHANVKLQRAWNKYGSRNFIFEIVDVTMDKKRLLLDEQYWIEMFDAVLNGYNICHFAWSRLGVPHSKKTRLKISRIQRGRVSNRKGVHLSKETKEKLRQANLGKGFPQWVYDWNRGKHFNMPDWAKHRISKARGKKNHYTILFEDGSTITMNYFHNYCDYRNIEFKKLHAWSIVNKNNDRVHPRFKIKILKLTVTNK
jgi:group I intron endonuclease